MEFSFWEIVFTIKIPFSKNGTAEAEGVDAEDNEEGIEDPAAEVVEEVTVDLVRRTICLNKPLNKLFDV